MTKEWNDIRAELGHECLLVPNNTSTRCVDTLFNNNFEFKVKRVYKDYMETILELPYRYGTEARPGPLLTEQERRIQAFEMKCFRRLLWVSYRKKNTKDFVRSHLPDESQESLLAIVNRQKRTANCHRGTSKYSVTQTVARCQRQMFDSEASRSRRG